jgi:hypothetical protein
MIAQAERKLTPGQLPDIRPYDLHSMRSSRCYWRRDARLTTLSGGTPEGHR